MKRFKSVTKKIMVVVAMIQCFAMTVLAETATTQVLPEEVTRPLNILKAIFYGIISAVGVFMLAYNIYQVAQAVQQKDTHGLASNIFGIIFGFLVAGIGGVMAFLGF